ncbi:MAG: ankyrin repeat domain-containing protein [Planctomycetota bacterium]
MKVTTEEGSEEPLTAEASVEVVSRTQRPADPTQSDNLSSTSGIAGIKISELICPVIEVPLKSKDGIDLSFAYRTPPGKGPYPAILFFHGGGGQSNLQRLKYDLLTGAVQTRFLQAGFIIVAATRRPYWKSKDANQPTGFYDAVEDARLIIEKAKTLPGVHADNVILYGGSGGGILAIVAASKTDLACVVAGEPATVISLDPRIGTETTPGYYSNLMENPAKSFTEERRREIHSWMKDIECPVLVLQGKHVGLYKTNFEILIPEMEKLNKDISSIHYPGVTHGFYWGRVNTGATLDTVEKVVKDVTAYIEKHATIERANCDIIYFAASRGDTGKVEALVRKGIDVNVADAQGCTALHYAAQEGHKEVVELLLSKDAKINAKNRDGRTPLELAASQRRKDVMKLLVEKGADIPTIHLAAFVGSLGKLRSFVQAGTDVDAKDEDGRTPLLRAIVSKHVDAVKFLIEAGADVNRRDEQGYVPLVHALWGLDSDMVKLLLDKGADVHAKDTSGYTPLHWAVMMGSRQLTELVLEAGADAKTESTTGETPLDLARQGGPEIVELLKKHGAKE